MDNLFDYAEACLHNTDIGEKLALTHEAKARFSRGELSLASVLPVADISNVKFPGKPVLLPPRLVPNRKLTQQGGVGAFFHAIAHIEFMAIYLAWDILYRFRGLPDGFYQDWLLIADEEAQHFELICRHLQTQGLVYGELTAHGGLWEHARETSGDLLARLALVPRCMEARGLDVTPGIISKFKQLDDAASVALLERILADEVGHVERGSYWFKWCCRQQGLEPESHYQQLLEQYYQGGRPKGPFNREMRIIAGFSDTELDWLENSSP
ncbi:MAG: ferritin-like domain-containing protein [Methylovulum sp.]|uniref:ferritin-like domain-containing protein n=1 Tax=Methylovulum sp. TaxID=1916980 RepID=UPI0026296C26|nr:ferritin-like domain-containing protein [Methylovulum sp.]MDD2724280.1 ferritin-like domain-containing protein [Methylovulum sp.]MDD5122987.1 ferritin-like domain-containing protein [Methylovulum sp.]